MTEVKLEARTCANPGCTAQFKIKVGRGSGRCRPRIYCRPCAKLRTAMRSRANVRAWRKRTRLESLAFRNLQGSTGGAGMGPLRLATDDLKTSNLIPVPTTAESALSATPTADSKESWKSVTDAEVQELLKRYQ